MTKLVEQPRVLDGDDGLGGEVLDKVDLFIVKWPHLLSINGDDADQFVFPDHWHPNQLRAFASLIMVTHVLMP